MKFIRVLKASNFEVMEEDAELKRLIDVYRNPDDTFDEEDIEQIVENLAYTYDEVEDFVSYLGYQIKEKI